MSRSHGLNVEFVLGQRQADPAVSEGGVAGPADKGFQEFRRLVVEAAGLEEDFRTGRLDEWLQGRRDAAVMRKKQDVAADLIRRKL